MARCPSRRLRTERMPTARSEARGAPGLASDRVQRVQAHDRRRVAQPRCGRRAPGGPRGCRRGRATRAPRCRARRPAPRPRARPSARPSSRRSGATCRRWRARSVVADPSTRASSAAQARAARAAGRSRMRSHIPSPMVSPSRRGSSVRRNRGVSTFTLMRLDRAHQIQLDEEPPQRQLDGRVGRDELAHLEGGTRTPRWSHSERIR